MANIDHKFTDQSGDFTYEDILKAWKGRDLYVRVKYHEADNPIVVKVNKQDFKAEMSERMELEGIYPALVEMRADITNRAIYIN